MMPATPTPKFASGWARFSAYSIDVGILSIPLMVLTFAVGEENGGLVLGFIATLIYYTVFTAGTKQASPGQAMLRLRVVRVDGAALDFRAAAERYLAYSLPGLPVYTSMLPQGLAYFLACVLTVAWFAPILFNAERAGLHDQWCGQRVLQDPKR